MHEEVEQARGSKDKEVEQVRENVKKKRCDNKLRVVDYDLMRPQGDQSMKHEGWLMSQEVQMLEGG